MKQAILPENVTIRAAELAVDSIIVRQRQREVSQDHVGLLRRSFQETGKQIVPIAVSERPNGILVLIDGAHRLDAATQEGWQSIRAEIYTNLDEEQEGVLEFVTNRARKDLSPAEILAAWETFDLPALQIQIGENRSIAGLKSLTTRGQIVDSRFTSDGSKPGSPPPASIGQGALVRTGHDQRWLEKVATIRDLAASEEAPAAVREAAERGFEKLHDPNVKVEAVFKGVQKMHEAVLRQQEDPEVLKRRSAEKRLDDLVRDVTLLQERVEMADMRDVLALAAGEHQIGRENLRAVRVALVHALATVMAVECDLDGDPSVNLRAFGGEVTKLLSSQAMRLLGLEEARHG
ncbi:ParB N-terminal domain-containing protein [Leucobacter celer]|uniref:ParB N-terminal domain-containing protein n=1 Tax=Leucobacter celer TaxID=668625 RepID=UPI0006A75F87|nr:ParB N-terminal domain-containing protein [Leucobacter celer]